MSKRKTTEEFIEEACKIHGDKYDYSKADYVNSYTKLCIICKKHGEFLQSPLNHLSGKGCKKCAYEKMMNDRSLSKDEFISKSIEKHNGKYDYSKVRYVNEHVKVCIVCPIHGDFWQIPQSHLRGCGCKKCKGNRLSLSKRSNIDAFIEKARKVHGDKYDYSKVEYVNGKTKVCIICPEHGEFWQTPNSHLKGSGCPSCSNNIRLTTEQFIEKAKSVHGNKYDYSKVEYINYDNKVCIVCPKHGEFLQEASNHLQGKGCPFCSESKLEREIRILLTDNNISYEYNKTKKWLNGLRLDFYLPEYNVAIECQGIQHFEPVDFAGKGEEWSNKNFLENKERDKLKKFFCDKNKVKLIYFLGNNINNILKEIKK